MRTLGAVGQELVAQRVLGVIPNVEITVVTDHTVPTLDAKQSFTSHPIQFRGDLPLTRLLPFLLQTSYPLETMSHLPAVQGGAVDTLQRRISFALVNAPYEDSDLFAFLTSTGRLDRALIMLQTLLVNPKSLGSVTPHFDTLDIIATQLEPVSYFDGVIDRVTAVGSTIQIEAKSDLPEVPWKFVPDDGSDPRDRGLRLPFPLGDQGLVRCVNLVVGAVTTLAQRLTIGDTAPVLFDTTGFDTAATAMFGAEAISWTGIDQDTNTLTGVTRAALGTLEADHVVGTVIFEADDLTLGVASFPVDAVTDLFILSNTTGSTIQVPPLLYSVDYNDITTLPGVSGDPITTIGMTALQISSLLAELHADATVTQQAVYDAEAQETSSTQADVVDFLDTLEFDQGTGANGTWATVTTTPIWTRGSGGAQQGLRNIFPTGLSEDVGPPIRSGLNHLISAQFSFQIDVTTIDTPITLGLTVTGAEGTLVGFVDGSVVASRQIGTTGVHTIAGTIYFGTPTAILDELDDVVIDFVKSEISTTGNPAIVFELDSVTLNYVWLEDVEEVIDVFDDPRFPDLLTSVASTGSDTFQGDWKNLADGETPSQVGEEAPSSARILHGTFVANPFTPDREISSLKFHFSTRTDRNAGDQGTITLDWGDDGNNWDEMFTSKPSTTTHTAPLSSITDVDTTLDLTSLLIPGVRTSDFLSDNKRMVVRSAVDTGQPAVSALDQLLEFHFEIGTIIKKSVTAPIARVADAQIQSAAGGVGLEFFAIVDGPVAPDASYDVASGEVFFHPSDIARYWLREVGGFAAVDIDNPSFGNAVTALPGYVFGFDARNLGSTWREILLRIGYESRSNLCRPSGGDWQMQQALFTHVFPAASGTIDSVGEIIAIGKDDSEILTRLLVYFAFDPRFESGDNRAFTLVQTTDPTDLDVVAREEEFGRKDGDPMFLIAHTADSATGVTDWREYMEQELARFARVFSTRVDHWEGFTLELGDIVTLTVVNGEVSEDVKVRVIETVFDPNTGIQVRFVEVL